MNIQKKTDVEIARTLYCEKYGIIESRIKGKIMVYYTSYPSSKEPTTYKVAVDLERFVEIDRIELKYYYKKGEVNSYL